MSAGILRLAYRKLIYRKVALRRYEIVAGESRAPGAPFNVSVYFLQCPEYDDILGVNPYLTQSDVDHFHQQQSVCIVIRDKQRVAACSWMTSGRVYVSELQRHIDVPAGQHYSCRSYVHDDYRGQALLSHMIHAYSLRVQPGDLIWGLIYDWNVASIHSVENLGWRYVGDYWTRFVFTRKLQGERHFGPSALETTGSCG